jgi:hypothetical protein
MNFETVEQTRESLRSLGYKNVTVARHPGEYSEEIENNDVVFGIVFPDATAATWVYGRVSRKFRSIG